MIKFWNVVESTATQPVCGFTTSLILRLAICVQIIAFSKPSQILPDALLVGCKVQDARRLPEESSGQSQLLEIILPPCLDN